VEQISRVGMDTSKHVFQLHGVNAAEVPVLRKKLRRKEMVTFFEKLAPTVIAIEACGASHHLARLLESFGHTVKLIAPQLVKPYVKRGKNDAADAEALCEAMSRPTMRFVPVKTAEQQAALMLVGVRDRLIRNRTQLANTIRGYAAEFGLTAAKGMAHLVPLLERIAADESLPALARKLFAIQAKEYTQLQAQIDEVDAKLTAWHRADECSRRLAKVPGVGPIGAVLLTMKTPDPAQFRSGRQFAAWIGLTPKDHSTAGKVKLGVITRAGDEGLRSVLVVGATAVIQQAVRSGKAIPLACRAAQAQIAEVGSRSAGQQDRAHRVEDDADSGRLRRESRGRRLGRRGLETIHGSASTVFRYVTLLRALPGATFNHLGTA
jgi:transposase